MKPYNEVDEKALLNLYTRTKNINSFAQQKNYEAL